MSDVIASPMRLERVLQNLPASAVGSGNPAEVTPFEPVLREQSQSEQGFASDSRGLADELFAFIAPVIHNPAVLHGARYKSVLEDLVADLSQSAARSGDPLQQRGTAVVGEELAKLQLLRQQLNGLIEA